jgi:predicted phosphoribosyltransferase
MRALKNGYFRHAGLNPASRTICIYSTPAFAGVTSVEFFKGLGMPGIITLPLRENPADGDIFLKNVIDLPELRERIHVFDDRFHAGAVLAEMTPSHWDGKAIAMAIPAGGVPVAVEMTKRLPMPLEVAVVSKITLPWNTEAGYGAVAFDGTVGLNQALIQRMGLTEEMVQKGIRETSDKVQRRLLQLRGAKAFPDLERRHVLLIDDGLASGFTMKVAVAAVRKAGAENVTIAVPTAHMESVKKMTAADKIFCPNLRSGPQFAVASAYKRWSDVTEKEAASMLERKWSEERRPSALQSGGSADKRSG